MNSNVAKVRWNTDEEATSRIEAYLAGTATRVAVAEERTFKKQHVLVVRGLTPGVNYDFQLMSEDPANGAAPGNVGTRTLTNVGMQPFQFQSVHVAQTALTVVSTAGAGQPVTLRADFTLVDETGAAIADGATVSFDRVEWIPGGGTTTNPPTNHVTGASVGGVASLTFNSVNGMGSGGEVEVYATAVTEPTSNRLYFHPLDGQFGHWSSVPLP
jgi:hypothetical protein